MSVDPNTTPAAGINGERWAQQSFGPMKYLVGAGAAALVFVAFGWQIVTYRMDTLETQRLCREHSDQMLQRLDRLIDKLSAK